MHVCYLSVCDSIQEKARQAQVDCASSGGGGGEGGGGRGGGGGAEVEPRAEEGRGMKGEALIQQLIQEFRDGVAAVNATL